MIMKNVSKRMYKFSIMIILLGVFLLMPKEVVAAKKTDCDKYQCITCEATLKSGVVAKWNIKSSGDGSGTVKLTLDGTKSKKKYFKGIKNPKFSGEGLTSYESWLSDDNNKLECGNVYAYQIVTKRGGAGTFPGIKAKFAKKENQKLKESARETSGATDYLYQKVKTKMTKTNNIETAFEGSRKKCTYEIKKDSSSDRIKTPIDIKLTVTVTGSKVKTKASPSEYKVTTKLSAGMFKDGCPDLNDFIIKCVDNSGMAVNKKCTIQRHVDRLHIPTIDIDGDNEISCDIFGLENEGSVGWILQKIFDYIKVIGPILVVLLSAIDFIKVILSSDEKVMKQAQSRLVIRLIAAIALFLLPTLIQLAMSLINQATCTLK